MSRRLIFPGVVFLALALSCTKEPGASDGPTPDPAPEGYATLVLHPVTLSEGSKATLGGNVIQWKSGDKLNVNGAICFVKVEDSGKATTTVPAAGKYEAFYPADIISDGTVLLQPSQYYAANSFGLKAFPVFASASGNELDFSCACGILRFTLAGTGQQVASVNIADNNGGKLCGSYKLEPGGLVSTSGVSFTDITLNCKSTTNAGVSVGKSGTAFNIVLPAGTYSKGLSIRVSAKGGASQTFSSSPCIIKAGEVSTIADMTFEPAANVLYDYHFDNLAAGGDLVANAAGFKAPSLSSPTGYEFYSGACKSSDPGAAVVVASAETNRAHTLSDNYMYSRDLQDFTLLCNCQEFHGCLGCGVNGNNAGTIKLPQFSGIPSGKVCKAVLKMKMAIQNGHSTSEIDIFPTYSTVGKVLEMYVDGKRVAFTTPQKTAVTGSMGDDSRWATQDKDYGIVATSMNIERVLVKPSDLSDFKWHDIEVRLGAVTNKTVIQITPHLGGTSGAYLVDDISVSVSDYDLPETFLDPSWIIGLTSTHMTRLSNQAKTLGFNKYIDVSLSYTFFSSRSWDKSKITTDLQSYADKIKAAGFRVWNIHLPATDAEGSYNTDLFEYFHADKNVRQAAVDLTKTILDYAKILESVNLMIHATGPGRYSYDFETYKDYGVESFAQLVAYCNSPSMRYSDGSYPVFCIENIQNTGTYRKHVCALAEYMNYYCEKVPGLKVCYDTSHGQVCLDDGETSVEYCRKLGTNLCSLHIHGNGKTTVDRHIFPGYKNGLYYSSGGNDIIDWADMYKVLIEDCKYTGPFTYEIGSNAKDCVASFSNIVHNYYTEVIGPYKNKYLK